MEQNHNIVCPKCNYQFDLNQSIRNSLKEEAKAEAREEYKGHLQDIKTQKAQLHQQITQFETQKIAEAQKLKAEAEAELSQKLSEERIRLKNQLQNEQDEQFKSIQDELNEKSKQLQEFHKAKAEVERLKRENAEIENRVEAQLQERLTHQLRDEREKIKADLENSLKMDILEKETVIQQLQNSLKDAQQKAEQGSMQLQGEVQELAIEQWLKSSFPLDSIDEVKKGEYGADIIQIVNNGVKNSCGKIAYESKRTKHWGSDWLEKFRDDMQRSGATVGILVTSVMPKDREKAFQDSQTGIWVCKFNEFKTIAQILRQYVIDIDSAFGTQKNRDEKMALLYDYMSGKQFETRITTIVDAFQNMKDVIEKERKAMTNHWKAREKELERIILNTTSLQGEIQGITGSSIETIEMLENELSSLDMLGH
jgi:hypothetical protein